MLIGKLENKTTIITKEQAHNVNYRMAINGYKEKFKVGDNAYRIARFNNGNPYNTYSVIMTRDEIVECLKNSQEIQGLKIDRAGRLIEDVKVGNNVIEPLDRIKKIIVDAANRSSYTFDLNSDQSEWNKEQKLIAKKVLNRDPDHWEVFDTLLEAAKEAAEENNLYIGGVYASDEIHNVCVSNRLENVISYVSANFNDWGFLEFDPDYVRDRLSMVVKGQNVGEPWVEFGCTNFRNTYEASLAIESIMEVDGEATYGSTGIWVCDSTAKMIHRIIEKYKQNLLEYELKNLMKNVQVFKKCGFKATDSQTAFRNQIKMIMNNRNDPTTIEDYMGLTLALQEIYYKNPENISCVRKGIIVVDKANIKFECKQYMILASRYTEEDRKVDEKLKAAASKVKSDNPFERL